MNRVTFVRYEVIGKDNPNTLCYIINGLRRGQNKEMFFETRSIAEEWLKSKGYKMAETGGWNDRWRTEEYTLRKNTYIDVADIQKMILNGNELDLI